MNEQQSPWAQPNQNWQPQSYRDAQGRDPRQPFGSAGSPMGHQAPQIQNFQEPAKGGPPWWLLPVGILAAVALVLFGIQFLGGSGADTEPTPGPSETVSADVELTPGSAATGGSAIPFEGNGTGYLEILGQNWDSDGLRVEVRIVLDEGQESFAFYLFNKETMDVFDPVDLRPVTVWAGEDSTTTVRFNVSRAESTLVLTNAYGRALTAMDIRG